MLCSAPVSSVRALRGCARLPRAPRNAVVRAEDDKVTREFDEASGQVKEGGKKGKGAQNADGTYYVDELPEVKREPMSKEMKQKMREEYVGFGGTPDQPLQGNYFLYIIMAVTFLIFLCYWLGYIPGPQQLQQMASSPDQLGAI